MKQDAPSSSPIAKEKVFDLSAENVEKTSGEPLLKVAGLHQLDSVDHRTSRTDPKAKNVTPAVLSPIPNLSATVARLGQKKSEAVIPIVAKRNTALKVGPIFQLC
jgi:hypothetical protein